MPQNNPRLSMPVKPQTQIFGTRIINAAPTSHHPMQHQMQYPQRSPAPHLRTGQIFFANLQLKK